MIKIRNFVLSLVCVALLTVPGAFLAGPGMAQSPTTIRLAMIPPRTSEWGRVFSAWNASLRTASGGTLQIHLEPSGSTGDEVEFVRRIRSNAIDAASLSAIGLSEVDRSLLALQAPGAVENAAQLDRVRTSLDPQIRQQLANNGMVLLGWSDLGQARIFSSRVIRRPQDLRAAHPWQLSNDVMFGELLGRVGATGVPLPLAGVLPALVSGQVDTVVASATAVSALQWRTHLTHVMRPSSAVLIGATLYSKDDYDHLTPAQRTALDTTAAQAHTQLLARVRRADDAYYAELVSRGMIEDDATPYDAEWRTAAQQTRDALVGRLYTRPQLDAVLAAGRAH